MTGAVTTTPAKNRARNGDVREETSEVSIDPKTGRVIAFGRMRKRTASADPFAFDRAIIPDGWDYQWVAYAVYGQDQTAAMVGYQENGWTPVPADRHPGMFMPPGYKGNITRDGQMLMERPMMLTMEARDEERRKALSQSSDARRQFGIRGAPDKGFVTDTADVRKVSFARAAYESTDGVPRPNLTRIPETGE